MGADGSVGGLKMVGGGRVRGWNPLNFTTKGFSATDISLMNYYALLTMTLAQLAAQAQS